MAQLNDLLVTGDARILGNIDSPVITAKTNYTDLAPEFSTSVLYNVGDVVVYDNALYKCKQKHNKTAWNANNFTQIKVFDYAATLQDVYGDYPYKTRVAQFSNVNGSSTVYYKIVDGGYATYNGPIIVRCIGQEPNYTTNIQEVTTCNDTNFQKHTFMRHAIAQNASGNDALGAGAYLITTGDDIWVAVKPNGTAKIELIAGISIEIDGTAGTPPTGSIEINGSTALDARYTSSITANSEKPLTSGALANVIPSNISSSNKLVGADQSQFKTLTTPITVNGTQQTTVEGALGAINTLASQTVPVPTTMSIPSAVSPYLDTLTTVNCKVVKYGRLVTVYLKSVLLSATPAGQTIIEGLPTPDGNYNSITLASVITNPLSVGPLICDIGQSGVLKLSDVATYYASYIFGSFSYFSAS